MGKFNFGKQMSKINIGSGLFLYTLAEDTDLHTFRVGIRGDECNVKKYDLATLRVVENRVVVCENKVLPEEDLKKVIIYIECEKEDLIHENYIKAHGDFFIL